MENKTETQDIAGAPFYKLLEELGAQLPEKILACRSLDLDSLKIFKIMIVNHLTSGVEEGNRRIGTGAIGVGLIKNGFTGEMDIVEFLADCLNKKIEKYNGR